MLQSLWIIYTLFAEKFKAKINTNIFRFKKFIFFVVYLLQKLCLFLIFKLLKKGAHLNFAMDATLHRYATASQMNYLSVEDSFSTLETEPQTSQLVSSLSRCLIAPPTYSQAWMTLRRTMSYQQSALHKFLFFICTFCFFIAHATSHFGPGFESVSSTIIFSQMLFTLHHNA